MLGKLYVATGDSWRTEDEMMSRIWILYVCYIPISIGFTTVWALAFPVKGVKCGAIYGFLIGLISVGSLIGISAFTPIPDQVILPWIVSGLVGSALAGVVVAAVYKPKAYMADEQNLSHRARRTRWNGWGTAMVISAAIALIAPLFGLLGTVFGMVGAFGELQEGGMGDPEALAGDVSTALVTTAGGIVVSVVGIILAIIFLVPFLLKLDKDKKAAFSESS